MTCSHAFLAKVERLCIPVFRHPRPHIVHKQAGGVGKCLLVLDTDADGTVEMQGRMADLDGRGAVAHHQLRQKADAQSLGHHGEDGPVLAGDVLHVGMDAHLVKRRHDLVVVALLQLDERLLRQRGHGERVAVGIGGVAGDNDLQFVTVQGVGLQPLHRRQTQKTAIHRAVDDPALDLVVEVAGDDLKLDVGVHLPEALEDAGQPLGGHAGEGGDFHQAAVHVLQPLHRLHEGMVGGAQLFDLGQHRPSVRRQHHAAAVAAQQLHAQFVFQRVDGVADAGLGEIHGLRRLGEAAAGDRFEKDLIFGNTHNAPRFEEHYTIQVLMFSRTKMRFTNTIRPAMIRTWFSQPYFYFSFP